MTRIVLITLLCCGFPYCNAQQLVSTAGGSIEQNGFVSWSIGEAVVGTHSESVVGFQQNALKKITGIEDPVSIGFTVYPNPSKDLIVIQLERPFNQEVQATVYNLLQVPQIQQMIPPLSTGIELDISKLTSGPYQILLVSPSANPAWLRFIKL